ncbi:Rieske 2Fe-2S domain-containing protein [Acidocella sp.]|uniref:aromatic ring-hydroxylating oxygenase subunit alpha n=1 Tax=Acidocella sp. TaxID=50710 RepID=UPI002616C4E2|nr:Rieske 2Fe-2S domain-containing protein [Acidocella sp.]
MSMTAQRPEARSKADGIDYEELIQKDRISGSLYTSEAVYRDELEKIFYGGWVYIGHESEVAKPGQYVRRTIGEVPVLLVRTREGKITVLKNRCTHRGNMLCVQQKGSLKNFTCAYHGWVFGLDGKLLDVPYPGGFRHDPAEYGLKVLPLIDSYRGFVFASFSPDAGSLDDHLGNGKLLIDRALQMSPTQEIKLTAGWVRHKIRGNWKMLPENDTDGYHVNFVHSSFGRVIRSQYDEAALAPEESLKSLTIDWGNGHTELDFSPSYVGEMAWLGLSDSSRYPEYVRAMEEAYGHEKAHEILAKGPPHAVIFPNLFLGEMNIVMFEPLGVNECVQWHTPLLLGGVPDEVNIRILRQSEGALGPSAFLLADDGVISERQQIALRSGDAWLDLSRGEEREEVRADGVRLGHVTDETTNRGFWHQYRKVMTRNAAATR